jgi:hypothetical protein
MRRPGGDWRIRWIPGPAAVARYRIHRYWRLSLQPPTARSEARCARAHRVFLSGLNEEGNLFRVKLSRATELSCLAPSRLSQASDHALNSRSPREARGERRTSPRYREEARQAPGRTRERGRRHEHPHSGSPRPCARRRRHNRTNYSARNEFRGSLWTPCARFRALQGGRDCCRYHRGRGISGLGSGGR